MLRADYESRTGGSRGVPSRLLVNFDHIVDRADNAYMVLFAHGVADRPQVLWHASPVSRALLLKKVGIRLSHLFTTAPLRRTREGLREAAFLYYTLIASRLFGRAIPWPRLAPRNDPFLVAHALSSLAARGQPGLLPGSGAGAVRVCRAAAERGLDLRGTVFHVAGEPLTPAKAAVFQSVGGRFMVSYVMSEMGSLGHSCARPHAVDDMHLLADRVAMVQREVSLRSGGAVSALFFTSLLATSPKVMLNTESGDWADVEERDCGCTLGDMGYRKHLSNVRSYEKLTSEGVTFRGTLLHDLMEEILPSHFGGQPFDYQLVEEEDESGLPRVNILVSPRVGAVDEKDVIDKVMQVLEISHRGGGRIMAQQWRQAGTLRVVRREPYETPSSKILPLHVLQKRPTAAARRE
jgi:hypothetical protein